MKLIKFDQNNKNPRNRVSENLGSGPRFSDLREGATTKQDMGCRNGQEKVDPARMAARGT
jgi:hypothetical protein